MDLKAVSIGGCGQSQCNVDLWMSKYFTLSMKVPTLSSGVKQVVEFAELLWLVFQYVCLCVHSHVYMCVCVYMCLCICVCVCR